MDTSSIPAYPDWVVKLRGIGRCSYCGRRVMWVTTRNNKAHPFDPDVVEATGMMRTHYATCPKKDRAKPAAQKPWPPQQDLF